MEEKINKYKLFYKIFLITGFFGLADTLLSVALKDLNMGFEDYNGALVLMIIKVFGYILGPGIANIAKVILPIGWLISSFWFIWFAVALTLRTRFKKLEKEIKDINETTNVYGP